MIFFYAGVFLAAGVAGFFGAGFSFFAIGVELTFFGTTAAFAFVAGVAFSFLGTGVAFVFFAGALADKTTGVATGIAVEATARSQVGNPASESRGQRRGPTARVARQQPPYASGSNCRRRSPRA